MPSLITLKHPTLFIFSYVNDRAPKLLRKKKLTGNDGDSLESTQNTKGPKCCQIAKVNSHCDVTGTNKFSRFKDTMKVLSMDMILTLT